MPVLNDIPEIILTALAVLIALSIHEYAHALVAYKLGDNTAKDMGRLTVNPLAHLDPVGAIFMLLFRFGWAKPVPINPKNFKKPKRDFALAALAGPASNIIMAFFSTLLFLVFYKLLKLSIGMPTEVFLYNTCLFLSIFSSLNVGLGVFNLIPVPPFDGSRLLNVVLPEKLYFKVMRYERQIYWVVIGWLFFGKYLYRLLTAIPLIASNGIACAVLRIFDLSGLIGQAISAIYDLMISFWSLIPSLG